MKDDAEVAAVRALQRVAYEVEAALIGTRMIPGLRESLLELRSAAEREMFWGCEVESGGVRLLAGIVAVEDEGAWLRVSRLAVDPAFFRRGVGRALVRWAVETAAAQRRVLKVSTGEANAPARRLYEAEGFHVIENYLASDGTALVLMEWRRRA